MWEAVIKRYQQLKALDSNCVIDRAQNHRYKFPSVAAESDMSRMEEKFALEFPPQLKSFYLEVGNGGPGPDAYVYPLEEIINLRAGEPWLGCDYYDNLEEDFEDTYTGLLVIMGAGYAHQNGIVANGDELGEIISFNSVGGWNFVQSNSLIDFYHEGLDKIFEMLNTIHEQIEEKRGVFDLACHLEHRFRMHPTNALVITATLVNIPFQYDPDARKAISYHKTTQGDLVFEIEKETQVMFDNKIAEYRQSGKSQHLAELYKKME